MNVTLTLTEDQLEELAERVARKITPRTGGEPYSLAEAAKALGRSVKTIRRRIEAGVILTMPNDKRRIPASEVERQKTPR